MIAPNQCARGANGGERFRRNSGLAHSVTNSGNEAAVIWWTTSFLRGTGSSSSSWLSSSAAFILRTCRIAIEDPCNAVDRLAITLITCPRSLAARSQTDLDTYRNRIKPPGCRKVDWARFELAPAARSLREACPHRLPPKRCGPSPVRSEAPVTNVGFHLAGYRYNPRRQTIALRATEFQLRSFKPFLGECHSLILRRSKKPNGGTRRADVLFLNLLGVAKAYTAIPQSQAVLGDSPEFAR